MARHISVLFVLMFFCLPRLSSAFSVTDLVPSAPMYQIPPTTKLPANLDKLSCYDLDMAINELYPYRSSYKPNFYSDPANKMASILFMLNAYISIAYWSYSSLLETKDQRRVITVNQQIDALRHLKAIKFCDI